MTVLWLSSDGGYHDGAAYCGYQVTEVIMTVMYTCNQNLQANVTFNQCLDPGSTGLSVFYGPFSLFVYFVYFVYFGFLGE